MNKNIKRFVSVLLAVLLVSALSMTALADGVPNSNEYTVTLSAGNVAGAYIEGNSSWTVPADTQVNFGGVGGLDDSPYYFKGFRPAGHDNNVIYSDSINVTEDADYVAAYGLRGDLVLYTVNYVDQNGNQMDESMTHYGNVGDKMIVGSRDIDGYLPQAYQLAKTLLEDESQNVFTFVYTPVVAPTAAPAAPAPTPYVYTEGAEGGAAGAAAGGEAGGLPAAAGEVELPGAGGEEAVEGEEVPEAGGPAAEAGGEQPEENAPAAAEQQPEQEPAQEQEPVQIEEEETPQSSGPQEIIDLDEEDTPLGSAPEVKEKPQTELQQERAQTERRFYIAAGLLGVSLIAIVTLVVLLVRKRKA